MTEDPPPHASRCSRGHRILWDRDGRGCAILGAEDNRVLAKINLDKHRWRDVEWCAWCGARIEFEQ